MEPDGNPRLVGFGHGVLDHPDRSAGVRAPQHRQAQVGPQRTLQGGQRHLAVALGEMGVACREQGPRDLHRHVQGRARGQPFHVEVAAVAARRAGRHRAVGVGGHPHHPQKRRHRIADLPNRLLAAGVFGPPARRCGGLRPGILEPARRHAGFRPGTSVLGPVAQHGGGLGAGALHRGEHRHGSVAAAEGHRLGRLGSVGHLAGQGPQPVPVGGHPVGHPHGQAQHVHPQQVPRLGPPHLDGTGHHVGAVDPVAVVGLGSHGHGVVEHGRPLHPAGAEEPDRVSALVLHDPLVRQGVDGDHRPVVDGHHRLGAPAGPPPPAAGSRGDRQVAVAVDAAPPRLQDHPPWPRDGRATRATDLVRV